MRILHTSDWHLGRSFKGVSLLEEQCRFIDQVVEMVGSEGVDLVVVAGDVFDRALPPVEAVEAWYGALERIVDVGRRWSALPATTTRESASRFRPACCARAS